MTFMLAFTAGYWTCMLVGFVAWVIWKLKHPKRHLFSELKEGMDALASTRGEPPHHRKYRDAAERWLSREGRELNERDRVQYEFLGMADREDVR